MRIIGFKYSKISVEKKKEISGKIDVNTQFNLGKVEKETVLHFSNEKDETVFGFDFTYIIDYQQHSIIEFQGKVYASVDKTITKELESGKKTAPKELRTKILNFLLYKTHVTALHLEEMMGIPFHIGAPRVSLGKK